MALRLARHHFFPLHLPYARPIRWAGHLEAGVDILLLVIETDAGLTGVGETPVRLNWHAATPKSLIAVIEEVFLTQMANLDLADEVAVGGFLGGIREHPLAKSLIDTACWDLRAQLAGVPIWRQLGASDPRVPISWTVTRAAPLDMARAAATAAVRYGVRAFKVKTGQGFVADGDMLRELRQAVGGDALLFADSNAAGQAADLTDTSNMLADFGVILFEDPCPFEPNDGFRAIQANSALPILVDNGCRSVAEAKLYLDVGAQALSVKIMKTGITESRLIADMAWTRGARVAVGISAASSLGAITALSLAAGLPQAAACAPCEETFFAQMEGFLHDPLRISGGRVELPATGGYHQLIDWNKVSRLALA
jgi:L-alanine-DL-glutamate epimerase-like enolase superfamily enzyme